MSIQITSLTQIGKLLAALRLRSGLDIMIAKDLLSDVIRAVDAFAKSNNIQVSIVSPAGERLVAFTSGGASIGATIGFCVGNLPGAAVGAVAGAAAGYALAHVELKVTPNGDDAYILNVTA